MATIAILGAGMMGSAMSFPLADRGHDVRLIGTHLDQAIIDEVAHGRAHPGLKVTLPPSLRASPLAALERAAGDAELFLLGVSSAGVRWAAEALAPLLARAPRPVLMVSKGLELRAEPERGDCALTILPDVFAARLSELEPQALRSPSGAPRVAPVAVAGPCIAGELARRVPTSVVFSGRERALAERWRELCSASYYTPRVDADVDGVELCAALKNAYALGVGFGAGLHERAGGEPGSVAMHNHEAAVFGQAVLEMHALVSALGGSPLSAVGLAGSGDLMVTCNGGRTGRFGKLLGYGHSLQRAVELMAGATLECLEILRVMDAYLARPSSSPGRAELPLLAHLIDVALAGAPVDVPFGRFARQ
ncbi:MAG: 2-dehydropantoate 2-reductase N-terminal domain-containing protein [Polyangiaceae bacterium]